MRWHPSMPELWLPFVAAFLLSVALTYAVRPLAHVTGAVARPKADRWHRSVIPMLGGVAIAGAVLLVSVFRPPVTWAALALVVGAALLAIVGLVDDFRPLRPQIKFLLQLVVTLAVVASGVQISVTGVTPVDQLITLAWLVGITNAFNLLDNMDGLAAGIGLIAAAFRCYFFVLDGNAEGAGLAAALCGALAGFLLFNFQPASIFMGDTGSLFLGMMVGGLNVVGPAPYNRGTVAVLMLPVLILLVPIFDTLFVSIARTLAGRSFAQGGRDHTSHRLVSLGLSERGAVLTLWAMAVGSGLVATLSYRFGFSYTVTLVGLLMIGVAVLGARLGAQRVYPHAGDTAVVRIVTDLQYKKQIVTIALDVTLVTLAYYSAYVMRFESSLGAEFPVFAKSLLIVLLAHVVVLGALGTYQDSWRHAALRDLVKLAVATVAATAVSMLALLFVFRFDGFSRAVFAIHALLLTSLLCGSRVLFRALGELFTSESGHGPRTVIYGAGAGGAMVLREVRANAALDWTVIGFIDDDRGKHQTQVNGVPVLGGFDQLTSLLSSGRVAQVVISTTAIPDERLEALTLACSDSGVRAVIASLQFQEVSALRHEDA